MQLPKALIGSVAVLFLGVALGYLIWKNATTPGVYDAFAICLKDKGFTFYGAYWCPHCTAQKKMFGASAKHLPYVECAIPGSQQLTQRCQEKNIKGFPTWIGPGDVVRSGEVALTDLAEWSGCAIPAP